MGKIKIKNRVRVGFDMRIYLDDHVICVLSSGGEFDIDIPAGQHKLKAKTRVFGSKDFSFTIFNKDDRIFTVSKTNTDIIFLISGYLLLTLLAQIYFKNSFSKENFPAVYAIIGIIAYVLYLFVSRNNTFVIREEGVH